MLTDDLIAKDEEDLDTPVGFTKEEYLEKVKGEKMTDLEEDNVVNRADIELVLNSEREIDKLREEYKEKCNEITDRDYNIRKALQERVCYLINMSYLKNYKDKIIPHEKYSSTAASSLRFLKDEFVISDDGKYVAFKDDGNYYNNTYIIPLDVILSNDPEKDKKFAEYVEAFVQKIELDFHEKTYKEKTKDLEYWKNVLINLQKKFDALYKDILNNSDWNIDVDGFRHKGKRLEDVL